MIHLIINKHDLSFKNIMLVKAVFFFFFAQVNSNFAYTMKNGCVELDYFAFFCCYVMMMMLIMLMIVYYAIELKMMEYCLFSLIQI